MGILLPILVQEVTVHIPVTIDVYSNEYEVFLLLVPA